MYQPSEPLEPRRLLSISLDPTSGTLDIQGTPAQDYIHVSQSGGTLAVRFDGANYAYPAASVAQISMETGDGADVVFIDGNILLPVTVDGGAGDDFVQAGNGPSSILGVDGNDRLYSGNANDTLDGGAGYDLI